MTESFERKTVLVAADTPFVRDRFKGALDAAGHRALVVNSNAEFLAQVRTELAELHLIVLDLRIANAGGVELVKSIRQLDDGRLPILVLSGSVANVDEVRELAALGVAGYLNEYIAVEHILPSIAPHLFPETINRRGTTRVVMGIPVSYRVGKTIAAALVLNLSRGGIAIRTSNPPPQGTVIRMKFALPGSTREMEAEGVACWVNQKAGMGIEFTSISDSDRTTVEEFVEAHFFRSVKIES